MITARRLHAAARDGDVAAGGIAAAADSSAVFSARGHDDSAADRDVAARTLEPAADAGGIAGASRIDLAVLDYDVAAGEISRAADAGRPGVACRFERAASLDGQRLPGRNIDARIEVRRAIGVHAIDDILAFKNDRRIAETRYACTSPEHIAAIVDFNPVKRHRRAVRYGYLSPAGDFAGNDIAIFKQRFSVSREIAGVYDRPLRDVAGLPRF